MKEDTALNFFTQNNTPKFKAKPLNRKIFENQPSLKQVDKKPMTNFTEFNLSKSNCKLGKRTFEEYMTNKEN